MISLLYEVYTVAVPLDRRFPPRWEKMAQFSVVWLTAQHFPAFKSHLSLQITFCHSSPKAAMVLNVIALIHLECVWANSWMGFKSYTVLWGMCACVYITAVVTQHPGLCFSWAQHWRRGWNASAIHLVPSPTDPSTKDITFPFTSHALLFPISLPYIRFELTFMPLQTLSESMCSEFLMKRLI